MEVTFELLIILNVAILFTIAYFLTGEFKQRITLSILASICWVSLGLGFMASNPTYPVYTYLFILIFLILILSTMYDVIDLFRERRERKEDWWRD